MSKSASKKNYLLSEGVLEVEQSGRMLGQMFPGTAFGELAILYNCKRTATVRGTDHIHCCFTDPTIPKI